jgi:hypothetical protein
LLGLRSIPHRKLKKLGDNLNFGKHGAEFVSRGLKIKQVVHLWMDIAR